MGGFGPRTLVHWTCNEVLDRSFDHLESRSFASDFASLLKRVSCAAMRATPHAMGEMVYTMDGSKIM